MKQLKASEPKNAWESVVEIVKDIPAGAKHGWTFTVKTNDGQEIVLKDVARIVGLQSGLKIRWDYGWVDDTYDAFKIQENEGGGDIILPATVIGGVVHLGLTQIQRNGNEVLEFPRAFINDGASVLDIAVNEAAAMCEKLTCDVRQFGGRYNPNSTFFVTQTWKEGEEIQEDGISYFILRVKSENLMLDKDGKFFAFRDEYQATSSTSGTGKKVLTCVFFPLEEVIEMVQNGEIHDQFVASGLLIGQKLLTAENIQN